MNRIAFERLIVLAALCLAPNLRADVSVIDQNGQAKYFFAEVVKSGPVVVNFIYTHCDGVCPGQGQRFKQLQTKLGKRLGGEVHLISVSIDPERDTPEALKTWSQRFEAGPHWTLVTGSKQAMEEISQQVLGLVANRNEHSPFIAVRGKQGAWQRLYGLSSAQQIITTLDEG